MKFIDFPPQLTHSQLTAEQIQSFTTRTTLCHNHHHCMITGGDSLRMTESDDISSESMNEQEY